jgi:ABC-2 type transport system permease protein
MMLPLIPIAIAFGALKDPDTLFMRILSFLPPTSPTVLPARLILGEIIWWEIVLSVAIMAASIWLMRRVAGRIFEASILTYGKEPGMGELWNAIRRPAATV